MSARAVCAFAALTLLHGTLAAAQPIVRLARDGRTIAVPQPLDENQPIRFRIEGNVTQPGCLSRRPEAGALQIRYDFVENLEPPGVLPWSGPVATPDGEFLVVPAPPGQTRFLVFNVWERSIPIATAAERERLMTCVRSRRTVEAGLGQARQQVTAAETVLRDRTTIVENRLTAVKRLLESIAAFQHVDGDGVDRVLLLQQRLVAARALLATAERDRETAVRDLEGRTATLRTLEGNLGTNADDFISATTRLSD
jgi:hypothetical protein